MMRLNWVFSQFDLAAERDGKIYGQGDRARGYRTRLAQAVALQIRDGPRGSGPSARVYL